MTQQARPCRALFVVNASIVATVAAHTALPNWFVLFMWSVTLEPTVKPQPPPAEDLRVSQEFLRDKTETAACLTIYHMKYHMQAKQLCNGC